MRGKLVQSSDNDYRIRRMLRRKEEAFPRLPFERKFSTLQRFWKLLVSPSEAMQDIVITSDYYGGLVILVLRILIASVGWALIAEGPPLDVLGVVVALGIILTSVQDGTRWLIKSWLVSRLCDSGGGWAFDMAASVTGYAYLIDVISNSIQIAITWLLFPILPAQFNRLGHVASELLLLAGLCWKSYIGALGTHFGTNKKCSVWKAFIVLFVLGLAWLLFVFYTQSHWVFF